MRLPDLSSVSPSPAPVSLSPTPFPFCLSVSPSSLSLPPLSLATVSVSPSSPLSPSSFCLSCLPFLSLSLPFLCLSFPSVSSLLFPFLSLCPHQRQRSCSELGTLGLLTPSSRQKGSGSSLRAQTLPLPARGPVWHLMPHCPRFLSLPLRGRPRDHWDPSPRRCPPRPGNLPLWHEVRIGRGSSHSLSPFCQPTRGARPPRGSGQEMCAPAGGPGEGAPPPPP